MEGPGGSAVTAHATASSDTFSANDAAFATQRRPSEIEVKVRLCRCYPAWLPLLHKSCRQDRRATIDLAIRLNLPRQNVLHHFVPLYRTQRPWSL